MLEFLDVAIGFATVMLAVSLIIMSLTQALSSLLALRGAKLRQGLEQLIRSTLPSVVSAIEKMRATPGQASDDSQKTSSSTHSSRTRLPGLKAGGAGRRLSRKRSLCLSSRRC